MKKQAIVSRIFIIMIMLIAGCGDSSYDSRKGISITATSPTAWEYSGEYLEFVINIGSPNETSENISVYFEATGTGFERNDIQSNPYLQQGYVEIPPGSQTAVIMIEGFTGNGVIEETQAIRLRLTGCSSGEYPIGTESEATAIIMDGDGEIVTDIDGNFYHTVLIGSQTWMVENLKTSRFRNGKLISESWCYDNDPYKVDIYGRLYSWYAVMDIRGLAPAGWHVPTEEEWKQLFDYLGGEGVAGGKLKAATLWQSPNTGATNESGFTAFPGGLRRGDGSFASFGSSGTFWSASENAYGYGPYCCGMTYNSSFVISYNTDKKLNAFSVRCIRD